MTYILIDFEATCCDKESIPMNEREIIEFGVVAVEHETLNVLGDYQAFVKPVVHPILTDFCTELTTITQDDMNGARSFIEVLEEFNQWKSGFSDQVFCSWGFFDKNQLIEDCLYHNVPYPFGHEHVNLKNEFSRVNGIKKNLGMKKAMTRANIELDGTHHRGIDDARNMTKLLPFIFGDQRIRIWGRKNGKN